MRKPIFTGSIVALLSFSSAGLQGATIVANAADATWSLARTSGATYDGGSSVTTGISLQNGVTTDNVLQVGGTSGNASIATAIIPFLLPTLSAGQTFSNVSFSIGQTGASIANQFDLYGLGNRASAAVLNTDYYRGTTGGDLTDATLLQGAFVGVGDTFAANAITSTSGAGGIALTDFLNNQYALGAGGKYVFLRLNVTDTYTTENLRLNPSSVESATASMRPTLTYSVIPEPSSAALLLLGATCFLSRRRK